MRIDIITIFPEICRAPLGESILQRARDRGLFSLHLHDLRDFSGNRHRSVDDEPYGGGPGMVMTPGPFFAAVEAIRRESPGARVLLMTPQGKRFDQSTARRLAAESTGLILLCGHYEGVDHRVAEALADEEISIGDYVLTNGTLAAAVVVDAVIRLLPGVLGDERSAEVESFSESLLEAPHYTRPPVFRGLAVPEVLLSGNHAAIAQWRRAAALDRTLRNRPDLLNPSDSA